MADLYIYACPMQMINFQIVTFDGEVTNSISNINCIFGDIIKTASKCLKEQTISNIFIVGNTAFADKIETIMNKEFNKQVNVERIQNG